MNANLKIRLTQVAGLLMLFGYWVTTAQPASAMVLPPGRLTADDAAAPTSIPAAPVVIHDHPSVLAYVVVAAIAVILDLALLAAVRTVRHASAGRPSDRLRPATV